MRLKRQAQALENFRYVQIRHLKDVLQKILADLERLDEEKRKLDIERGINLKQETQRFETEMIQWALKVTGGHQGRAASLLNLKPTTLNAKMKGYGISWSLLVKGESETDENELSGKLR